MRANGCEFDPDYSHLNPCIMLPLAHLPKHRSKALFTVSLTIARRSVFFAGASGAFCSGHAPPTAFWGAKERDALGGAAVDIGSAGRVRGLLD
jgi:hypothetical protein